MSVTPFGSTNENASRWQGFRDEMPVARRWAYFDHAAVAPLPRATQQSMQTWLEQATEDGDTLWPSWAESLEKLRAMTAQLIAAEPDEIALVPNTTTGISLVADGFPWQNGDNIVTLENEFPSNVYPWLNQSERGVELRRVPVRDGRVDYQRLADACDTRTRVVTVSWVGYASGFRLDVEQVSAIAHDRGALLFLDAIQGLGVFPLDVRRAGVDFLAADGHKWLLGPEGAGVFFVRREHLRLLRPLGVGWNSVAKRFNYTNIDLTLRDTAARYEGGSMNMIGFTGLAASMSLLMELGVSAASSPVADRVLQMSDLACQRLADAGAQVISPRDSESRSGIVVFELPGHSPERLRTECRAAGIVVSCRGGGVRLSLHAYNDPSDIERLVECLKAQ